MISEYRKLILIFSSILFCTACNYNNAYCQSVFTRKDTLQDIIGKFNSPQQADSKFTSEVITLSADSTFQYIFSSEFTKIKANGYWNVSGDSLILNSSDKRKKIIVEEKKTIVII